MSYGALQHDYIHGDAKVTVVIDGSRLKVGVQVPYWVETSTGESLRKWENRADLAEVNTKGMDNDQITQTAAEYFGVAKSWLIDGGVDVIAMATGEVWYSNRPIKDSFHKYEAISYAKATALSDEERASLEALPHYGMF